MIGERKLHECVSCGSIEFLPETRFTIATFGVFKKTKKLCGYTYYRCKCCSAILKEYGDGGPLNENM